MSSLVTAVIGAGPAGLLFCIISKILFIRQGGNPENWSILLFDKRDQYIRTHRLRIAPEAYYAIQKELKDENFDSLIDFLKEHHFSPTVNLLEEKLESLANNLGINKENLWVAKNKDKSGILELRQKLESENKLKNDDDLTIVAADSVHSTIREMVRGNNNPVKYTHQTVARLRVFGKNLPAKIGVINQYKLSKVLHSLIDYRLNNNGFAEIDLFLDSTEHHLLENLGSSPKNPLLLTEDIMNKLDTPLFSRFVYHLNKDITESACQVYLQSTFRLEHQYMEKLTYSLPEFNTDIFLLGDAAISLPFFRGMACLASCAKTLAQIHCDIAFKRNISSVSSEINNDIQKYFMSNKRSLHFGTKLLPGKILKVEPTIHNGVVSFVVLHYWLMLYGVHVLNCNENGIWTSTHHLAPVGRSRAIEDFNSYTDNLLFYEKESKRIRSSEISTVNARARLVKFAREFCRISTFLPFPLQTWFLSFPEPNTNHKTMTAGLVFNSALALLAAITALSAPIFSQTIHPSFNLLWIFSLIIQIGGGIVFRAAQEFEPGSHKDIKDIWRFQIAILFILGVAITIYYSVLKGTTMLIYSSLSWFILGMFFIIGMYIFESLGKRWFKQAKFE